MLAFAANSLLCRLALRSAGMDAASFTAVRLISGAATLWLLMCLRGRRLAGDWWSSLALFVYAAAFSYAYVRLSAGSGALILFGAVQTTMLGYGLYQGERLRPWQVVGVSVAVGGLVWLVLPGVAAPPPGGAAMMAAAGTAWGVYSLRGRRSVDAAASTAGNFLRTVPLALLLCVPSADKLSLPWGGYGCALASGVLTSGLGYIVWYAVLPRLAATRAAIVQLSVPLLAAVGGVGLLNEALTPRLLGCAVAILGGIALVILAKEENGPTPIRSGRLSENERGSLER